jgi:hypothetical protein
MSQKKASKVFRIPRTTLQRYIHGGCDKKQKLGRRPLLSEQQESDLVERIIRLARVGYPLRPPGIRRFVFKFCMDNHIRNPFSKSGKTAGKRWFYAFMKRHPRLSERKPVHLNEARAQKLNKFIVDDYFTKLKTTMESIGVMHRPEKIFNMDEKGIRLCQH